MTCHTCRWSCGAPSKDNKGSILLCLHPKNVSRGKDAEKVCGDWQREVGADEPEEVGK